MYKYILKRLLIIIPTLIGISIINFGIINLAPGGPVERKIREIRFGAGGDGSGGGSSSEIGVSDEVVEALKKQYGFDKPIHVRYFIWLGNLLTLDFGESFTYEEPVVEVIVSKFPVSLQFGIATILLSYLLCIPLGVGKAIKNGQPFDTWTSVILFLMYSAPPFMLAILLIHIFAGGEFFDWFPIGEIYSDQYEDLTTWGKIKDRVHHFILPLFCYVLGSFTTLTLLMKNSLIEEVKKDYVRTARAKGVDEKYVFLKHALRNALIPIVTGLGSFLAVFFAGSILLETIFQLDGIGLLSYKSLLDRDYNVIMGLMFFQSLALLVGNLISDLAYVIVDPRIDFQ